jgi:hypothetical protein
MLGGVVLLCLVAGERGGHAADLPLAPHQGGNLVQLHIFLIYLQFKIDAKI